MGELMNLLTTFSPLTILLCCIMILLVFKGLVEYKRWVKKLRDEFYEERRQQQRDHELACGLTRSHDEQLQKIANNISGIKDDLDILSDTVQILVQSDKDDIKAWVTEQYHKFYQKKGWIDDYTLDCIQKRYSHYLEEGGNSFIETLMNQLRSLPHTPPEEK